MTIILPELALQGLRRAPAVALFLVLSSAAVAADDRNVQEIPSAGVSLKKPDGWTFAMQAPSVAVVQDPAADGAIFVLASQAMPRTPPPDSAPDILSYTLKALQQQFADFTIEEPLHATTVAGRHAAEVTAIYSHTVGKQTIRVRSRILVVPREGGILVLTLTAPPDAGKASLEKLAGILESVKISD